ncbi:uncharacterized protein DUF2233 [Actinomadura pelletieri DSM 43383]|uniref:Uncharacterized protein DUF2233 n=1 Tax=Actinomadura pelletieri DSM 43383 TaxID=1120940 RepID=A0A495QTW3_9ACTN|nr:phosphodiester glycosidase family protein [Actinomadura pelletieri]RKS76919.1 uncharacterized protein DUF2233 [Actinomadura pelletieri DSM 43383]
MSRRLVVVLVTAGMVAGTQAVPAHPDVPAPPDADGAGSGERPDARTALLAPSRTVGKLRFTSTSRLATGVVYRTFETTGTGGAVIGDLLDVDLRARGVSVDLLRPPDVAARRRITAMANAQRAIAGVNGDFFNAGETHAGVAPTGASSGPAVADGDPLKGAVPKGQRFGPSLPPGTSAEDVIGVDTEGRGRLGRLRVTGAVRSDDTRGSRVDLALRGLNQYALPVGSVGAFTDEWGSVSRRRAVCGTDKARRDPCSKNTAEVTVRKGVVTKVSGTVGAGAIPDDTTVLVGREKGADALRALRPGDRVKVSYGLTGSTRFRFAVGGFPILRDGEPLKDLDPKGPAPRTAAGVSRDGRHLYLVVVDGRSKRSAGLTVAELASLMDKAGADGAVNLDGGGSSTFVTRTKGKAVIRNEPSDGSERAVANGIGVFVDD